MSDETRPYRLDAFGPHGVLINGYRVRRTDDGYAVRTPDGGLLAAPDRQAMDAIVEGDTSCTAAAVRTSEKKTGA